MGAELDIPQLVQRCEALYGPPPPIPRFDPMDELVSCILSQHTSDANSLPAFFRLKEALPTWEAVVAAGQDRVADLIRSAGLANQKSKSILACLERICELNGAYCIDQLSSVSPSDARAWLEQLPGVGPKTASIVLCFSFGMDVIPVDTHVFRAAWRLGLFPRELGESRAHDVLNDLVPKGLGYRFHMALIQHGRAVCRAPRPRCEACEFTSQCAFFRKVVRAEAANSALEGKS